MFRRKKPREAELDAELRFHVQELIDEKISSGMPPDEARRQAWIEFGGSVQITEECRDVRRLAFWESVRSNFKAALRFMRKSPLFSLAIVLTMALGIGANSAVFSAIDAVILKPLPFPQASELVVIHQKNLATKGLESPVAPVRVEDWNRLNSTFQAISGYFTQDVSETSGSLPEKLTEAIVAPRFLQVWGLSPVIGRDFAPNEEHFGGPNVALISDRLWRERFQADPSAVGRKLHFGSFSYTVVGVLPPSFTYPDSKIDFWAPGPPDAPYAQSRDNTWFYVFGRLKHGVTLDRAGANIAALQTQLGRQYPQSDKELRIVLEPLKESIVTAASQRSLWLLFGSVSLLLAIACTNIAALLLARTSERAREIAIRYSLGASRGSVLIQLLSESLVLAFVGAMVGLAVAAVALRLLKSLAVALPRTEEISLNWRIVLYALACALLSNFLFGLLPALRATRRGLSGSLSGTSRAQVSSGNPLQWLLVGVQVALAVTLLIGAALLLRSFQALGHVAAGFDPGHVLTFRISGSWGETVDMKALNARVERELDALRGTPGVLSAASAAALPGTSNSYPSQFRVLEGRGADEKVSSDTKPVSVGYFDTLHIPMLSGQACRADMTGKSVVVNRSFAQAFFANRTVLGTHLQLDSTVFKAVPAQILGIAADARENGINHAPAPVVYWCISAPDPSPYMLVRTVGDSASMTSAIRRTIHGIEPSRSVFDFVPLEQSLFEANGENRFRTTLLSLFALTAISLAIIGLYGTLSYFVTLRHREVGLRMALGALPAQILSQFFFKGLVVAFTGCVAGIGLAVGLSRFLASMLFGVSGSDFMSYGAVSCLVLVVAAIASLVPAARAAHVDPMKVLREQ